MGRRANNEGTKPYKTKDGRWRSDVTLGTDPITGKRVRRPVYGKTQALCVAERRKLLREVEDGTITLGKAPTLAQWLEHWLEAIKKDKLAYSTYKGYRFSIDNHVAGTKVAKTRLDKLTPEAIESLYKAVRDKGLKAATAMRVHAVLNSAIKAAFTRDKVATNPMDKVEPPTGSRDEEFEPELLDPDNAKKLIAAAEKLPLEEGVRWMIALTYGPRQSEVLGMGWDCVDFERGQIDLKRKLYSKRWEHGCADPSKCSAKNGWGSLCPKRHGGGRFFGVPKSRASSRSYPMPPQLQKKMKALHDRHLELNKAEGDRRKPYTDPNGVTVDLVFCQLNGQPYHGSNDSRAWRKFMESAGVEPVRLHDARHTSATMMLELGTPPRTVMELMGWTQMSMLSRYQHVLDSMKQDTAAQVGDALWG